MYCKFCTLMDRLGVKRHNKSLCGSIFCGCCIKSDEIKNQANEALKASIVRSASCRVVPAPHAE